MKRFERRLPIAMSLPVIPLSMVQIRTQ
jgi:hypothetical protein